MIEKKISSRIVHKHDTLANWNLVKDTFKPRAGEICIAKIDVNDPANKLLAPVMIKVGDGTSTWGQLDWISAKAADVYAWAKKSGIDVEVVDVEDYPDGDEHGDYPIVNFAWDEVNKKLVATKGAIDTDAIEVAGNGSGYAGGNLTDWMNYVLNLMWGYSYDSEQAHNNLFNDITKEGSEYKRDGSQVVVFYRDYESGGAYNAYTAEAVDIAITHDQVTDFDTEVKSVAADEINRLINAADPEGGKTIQDIENLVKYVDENAGEIAGLITDVGTAKSDAASAVATAGAAKTAADDATEAVEGLHAIATSGSIYDIKEGSNVSTGTDTDVKYLVFNCGTASTVI